MSRIPRIVLSTILYLVIVSPVFAGDADNVSSAEGLHVTGLEKQSFQAGKTSFEIHAGSAIDVEALVGTVKKTDSPQTIHDKINARRKWLYPDEPLILSIQGDAGAAVSLVRAIYWWNSVNTCKGCYWFAQYYSTTATMFTDDIVGT